MRPALLHTPRQIACAHQYRMHPALRMCIQGYQMEFARGGAMPRWAQGGIFSAPIEGENYRGPPRVLFNYDPF